jgi:four helix bundle protein
MDEDNSIRQYVGPWRLGVYRLAVELATGLRSAIERARRFDSDLADHMRRALSGVVLCLAEGCGREGGRDRARFYSMAKASGCEVVGCLDLLGAHGLGGDDIAGARVKLDRLLAMVAGLIRHPA